MSLQTRLTDLITAVGADIKDLRTKVGPAASVTQEGWHYVGAVGEPAFQHGWVNYDAARTLRFKKDPSGRVRIAGWIKSGSAASVVFTLPDSYRPPTEIDVPILANGAFGFVAITPDGSVAVIGSNVLSTLDSIEFETGQSTFPASLSVVPQEAWHVVGAAGEPAFANGWTFYDGTSIVQFKKYPDGRVRLDGLVKSGAIGQPAFTLPAGYRPVQALNLGVASSGAFGSVQITTAGVVTPLVGNNAWVSLGSIEFDTGQTSFPASVVTVDQEGWHNVGAAGEPAFGAGFSNYAGQTALSFKRDPSGQVSMRGIINTPAIAANNQATAFTLPAGYRPSSSEGFAISSSNGPALVRVLANGQVVLFNTTGFSGPVVAGWIDLSQVVFTNDQTTFPAGKSIIPVLSALPTNTPSNGDEIYFQSAAMATDGVMWHLRYNAASASVYKWEYLGGGPLYKAGTKTDWNDRSTPNNTANSYIDPTAPQITAPLAGDYEAEGNATCVSANPTGSPGISIEKNGFTPAWNLGDSLWSVSAGTSLNTIPVNAYKRILAQPAGTNIVMWYLNANIAGSVSFYNARMRVKPIRVG